MKSTLLGILTVAGLALANPALARGHGGGAHGGHAGGAHFSHGGGFSGARSFNHASGGARFRGGAAINRSSAGAAFRGHQFAGRATGARYFANHSSGVGHHGHHHHGHHHHSFVGLYGWPYYGYGYGYYPYGYGYGGYYGAGYGYDDGSVAADVQGALADLGYYRGPIDGVLGPRSRQAIATFQSRNGMRPTGRVDQRLLSALQNG